MGGEDLSQFRKIILIGLGAPVLICQLTCIAIYHHVGSASGVRKTPCDLLIYRFYWGFALEAIKTGVALTGKCTCDTEYTLVMVRCCELAKIVWVLALLSNIWSYARHQLHT